MFEGMDTLEMVRSIVSWALGFIYFTCWSLSFYPQPLANYKRGSMSGTSIEMPIANLVGFACYTIYTSTFLFSPLIKSQYAARHPENQISTVSGWDFAFAAHAFVLVAVLLGQCFWWRGKGGEGEDMRGRIIWGWVMKLCVGGIGYVVVIIGLVIASFKGVHVGGVWEWIDVIYAMSHLKLFLTLVKYTPQVILNYRRKSTEGWSIYTILLDLPGGVADVGQLLVDSGGESHGISDGVRGNMVKLLVGVYSMGFDIIFLVQHYLLYPNHGKEELDEESPLLA